MKTESYNPSPLEVSFANILIDLKEVIEDKMVDYQITNIVPDLDRDNPIVTLFLTDQDQDKHELVVRVIQRSDELVE